MDQCITGVRKPLAAGYTVYVYILFHLFDEIPRPTEGFPVIPSKCQSSPPSRRMDSSCAPSIFEASSHVRGAQGGQWTLVGAWACVRVASSFASDRSVRSEARSRVRSVLARSSKARSP